MNKFIFAGTLLTYIVGFQLNAEELSTAKKIEYNKILTKENSKPIVGQQSGGTAVADLQIACKDNTLHIPVDFTPDFITQWEKENFNASCLCGGVRYEIAKICEAADKKDLPTWVAAIKSKIKMIKCTYAGGKGDSEKNKAVVTLKDGTLNVAVEHQISQNCKSAGGFAAKVLKDSL